ncbi:MAG: hypothetical protein ACRDZQ_00775 [Acidimicrobiales bacterium]
MVSTTFLVTIEILSACVWVGSLACLTVVSSAARHALEGPSQVALFRALGRRYAIVGSGSLLVAIGAGLTLVWPPSAWPGTIDAAAALTGLLVLATAAGMAQARAITRLRRRAEGGATARPALGTLEAVRRGRVLASSLRSLMAVVTVAIVVLVAVVISH